MALDTHGWIDDHRAIRRHDDGDLDRIYWTRSLVNDRGLIFWGYWFKVIYEVVATPITYWIVNNLKRAEGIDVYDRGTNFNPFARARNIGMLPVWVADILSVFVNSAPKAFGAGRTGWKAKFRPMGPINATLIERRYSYRL